MLRKHAEAAASDTENGGVVVDESMHFPIVDHSVYTHVPIGQSGLPVLSSVDVYKWQARASSYEGLAQPIEKWDASDGTAFSGACIQPLQGI